MPPSVQCTVPVHAYMELSTCSLPTHCPIPLHGAQHVFSAYALSDTIPRSSACPLIFQCTVPLMHADLMHVAKPCKELSGALVSLLLHLPSQIMHGALSEPSELFSTYIPKPLHGA